MKVAALDVAYELNRTATAWFRFEGEAEYIFPAIKFQRARLRRHLRRFIIAEYHNRN